MIPLACPTSPPTPRPTPPHWVRESAQSTLEFVGILPIIMLGALLCVQALLLACALVFAQSAVDRAARGAAPATVVSSIPAPWRRHVAVRQQGGRVTVSVRPPSVVPMLGSRLRATARAEVSS